MIQNFMKRKMAILATGVLIVLAGCGYKPSSHYIKKVFDDTVYVNVVVSPIEPENAAYVKDALHRMIINRFGGRVVPKAEAKSFITASYNGTRFVPVSYDANGYIVRYRAYVNMRFVIKTSKGTFQRSITSTVEESITASSTLSSGLRIEAIRVGMEKALDQFLAYVSSQGALKKEKTGK